MAKREPRIWYLAVGDMAGEYAGNPLAFDASQVYGPFTEKQVDDLVEVASGFPHESHDVRRFQVARKVGFRALKEKLRGMVAGAQARAAEDEARTDWLRANPYAHAEDYDPDREEEGEEP